MSAQDGPSHEGSADFEFDLAGPLFQQIRELLDKVNPVPMDEENLGKVPERAGVYVLHHLGEPVYIGKADKTVQGRLRRHCWALSGRKNLSLDEMTFRCVCFDQTWNPFLPESFLTEHYGTNKGSGWNGKGFGGNEPGINRRGTVFSADNFHLRFPLQEEWECESIEAGEYDALALLRLIKKTVPFYFAFQGNKITGTERKKREALEVQEIYLATKVRVPRDGMTARELLVLVARSLPGAWQASITPSHMLLNRGLGEVFEQTRVVWPQDGLSPASGGVGDVEDACEPLGDDVG